MKTGIIIAMAALGLALFAVPDAPAQAWRGWHKGPDLNLRLSGSNFITSSQADGTPSPLGAVSTSLQSGIVKGRYGGAIFSAQTIIDEAGQDDRCGQLPGAPLSTTSVLTYPDGSILTLETDSEVSYYCYNPNTGVFTVEFAGTVGGGARRFEGASGFWEGTAEAVNGRVQAHLQVDLD